MVTLAQSNTYLKDREATRLRIVENVRQSSAFEGVKSRVRQSPARPSSIVSAKKTAGGTSTVLKQAASAAGLTGTSATAEKAVQSATGTACADSSCAVPVTK